MRYSFPARGGKGRTWLRTTMRGPLAAWSAPLRRWDRISRTRKVDGDGGGTIRCSTGTATDVASSAADAVLGGGRGDRSLEAAVLNSSALKAGCGLLPSASPAMAKWARGFI